MGRPGYGHPQSEMETIPKAYEEELRGAGMLLCLQDPTREFGPGGRSRVGAKVSLKGHSIKQWTIPTPGGLDLLVSLLSRPALSLFGDSGPC